METNKVYQMPLAKVAKAERKGRSESEVRQIVQWLNYDGSPYFEFVR